jgi:hypothetical protein
MKQLLLLTAFIFAISITYGQTTEKEFTKSSINWADVVLKPDNVVQTKNIVEEPASVQVVNAILDKTTEALSGLATALKVPAEHVYTVLVRQQRINSIQLVIVFILLFVVSYLMIRIPYNDWKKTNYEWWNKHRTNTDNYYNNTALDNGWWLFCIVPGGIIASISLLCLICYMKQIVTGFINPEYGAIKDIMSIL